MIDIDMLGSALRANNIKMVRQFIQQQPELLNQCPWGTDRTLLHYAAIYGLAPMIDALLDAGADTSLVDGDQKTALELAIMNGNVDCVEALLEHEAPPVQIRGFAQGTLDAAKNHGDKASLTRSQICLALVDAALSGATTAA